MFLEDKLLQTIHNLKTGSYSFATVTGTFNDRFVLRYTDSALGTPDVDLTNQLTVLSNNQVLKVRSRVDISSIEVYDMVGRRIYTNENVNTTEFSAAISLPTQALLVKVGLTNGTTVTKKIVH
ncbi:MAG: T9SS sorting signal type C domain-containing protein [Proteobacteria bacterium]|nr:MAG: T9SS sorting signal type C domain-containing protein [Pseudomonadota bacterium]